MDAFFMAFASLIVVIGPWKAAIVFAERTTPLPLHVRRLVAIATVVSSLVIAAVFVLLGPEIIEFFHIEPAAFLVAAGLLVVVFAVRMVILDEHHEPGAELEDESRLTTRAWRLAAYPLSIPLLVTPPAIATLVALGVQAEVSNAASIGIIAAILAVMAFNLVVFLAESQWVHVIPREAWSIAGRVLGVLLAAFGVSIILDGIRANGLLPPA